MSLSENRSTGMAVFIVTMAVALSCLAGPLPLPGPSFETDGNGDGIPDGWQWRVGQGEAKCEIVEGTKGNGQRAVKLMALGSATTRAFLEGPRMPVKRGQAYVFSCWARSAGVEHGVPLLGIARYKETGKWDDWSHCLRVPANKDWAFYRQVFVMPETTAHIAFRVWIENFQGTAWFDDVALEEYQPPKPGWTDTFQDLGRASVRPAALTLWQTDGATLARSDRGATLRSERQRDFKTLFPIGRMTREVVVDLDKYPCLAIDIADVQGLWALKVRERGYLQYATGGAGSLFYDVRRYLGQGGERKIKLTIETLGDLAEVTVSGLRFLPEAPPAVPREPERVSRYVTPDVTLEGLKRDLRHPFVALSREDIARAKGKGKAFDEWLANCRRSGDAVLKEPVSVPDEPYVYVMEYNCPQHGVPLSWRSGFPTQHLCPVGNHVVTGEKFDQQWRIQKTLGEHSRLRGALRQLGLAYAFTGDERYAAKAREILIGYTEKFPNYPWHTGRGELTPEGNGMRVTYEPLGEAGWLAEIARGYDLVASSACFSDADHKAIKELLADDVQVSLRSDEGLSNRQAHHNLAVLSVGLILGDDFLIKRALGSLRYQLKYGVLGDGLWWECSPGYHFFAVQTLLEVAETFRRVGINVVDDAKLRLSFDGPLRFLWPDGTFPAVNDSHLGMKLPTAPFELFYELYRDPVYAGILKQLGDGRQRTFDYLIHGAELGDSAPLPEDSHNFYHGGMVMLKAPAEDGGLSVVMDYGQAVAGHGHADKLNLLLFGNGKLLLPDIGSRSYFSPVWRFWDRQTISHNTVVVDERSQNHERGRLTLCDVGGPLQVVQATADESYPGLKQTRTVFVTPRYMVDLFRVADEATDVRLNPGPIVDIPFWTKEPRGGSTPESLRRDLAHFERSRDAHSGKYAAMIARSEGLPAAWASEICSLTGPNTEYRHGVIPVQPGALYRLSAWVKTDRATGKTAVEARWLNEGGRPVGALRTESIEGTAGWRELSATATAPSNARSVQVWCLSHDNAGAAWFDDISMVRTDDPLSKNALTPNFDFETTTASCKTIDYVLHGYGTLSSDVALKPAAETFGENMDDPTRDGRNSYRFLKNVRAGETAANWRAQWQDGPAARASQRSAASQSSSGLRLHMLGGLPTRIFMGDGQGPGVTALPMLMVRRVRPDTVFAAVLEPIREGAYMKKVSPLRVLRDGQPVPDVEACGLAVDTENGRELYAASFSPGEKLFEGLVLDGPLGSLAVSGDGKDLRWMYLLDGRRTSCTLGSISTPGSYRLTIAECDDQAKTVSVEEALPPGEILKGDALVLDGPYNECYTVSNVATNAGKSVIHLDGLPNLYLRKGMTAKVAVRAMIQRLRPDVFAVRANAPAEIRIARGKAPVRAVCRNIKAAGRTDALPSEGFHDLETRYEDGMVVLNVPASAKTVVAFDPPSGALLDDDRPPTIEKLVIDGVSFEPTKDLTISFLPQNVSLILRDESGLDPAGWQARLNGKCVQAPQANFKMLDRDGKEAQIEFSPGGPPIESLDLRVEDTSLLRNALSFRLRTAPMCAIVPVKEASGGKVAKLLRIDARLVAELDLPKGDYEVNIIGRAPSESANSVWIELDGQRMEDAVHIRIDRLGNSSRHYDLRPEFSRLTVSRDGPHTTLITLREPPGPELDKLQILRDGKVVKELECEQCFCPIGRQAGQP